ncbi:MAG: DUF456 domain-containing protein [Spirochaetota bacterium]|nr:MAG: DUF456 domain-containing protein [Spirochaetota bacterium]
MELNILVLIGSSLILAGIAGCIFPVIPGLILSYTALILVSFSRQWEPFSISFIVIMGLAVCAVTTLDFLVPRWRKKRYGASKPGVLIAVAGMLIGLWLLPPRGIVIGAFIGALIGELLVRKREKSAFSAGAGVFVGTILGIMLKICLTGLIAHYFLNAINLFQ